MMPIEIDELSPLKCPVANASNSKWLRPRYQSEPGLHSWFVLSRFDATKVNQTGTTELFTSFIGIISFASFFSTMEENRTFSQPGRCNLLPRGCCVP